MRAVERHKPQERRVMTDETIDRLTAAINRLADGLEEVINRLDLIAGPVKEGKEKNPPCTPLKKDQEKLPNAREGGARHILEDVQGPENLHREKIMKRLKIGRAMYFRMLQRVDKNLV